MTINRNIATHVPPYRVIVIDATDALFYADIMGEWTVFDTLKDFNVAMDLADALFVQKNYKWKSLQEMNNVDGGFDVRIYDQKNACVYAAHEGYKENWIGSRRKVVNPDEKMQVAGKLINEVMEESKNIKLGDNINKIHLTQEEQQAVDSEWKLCISQLPEEKGEGEWYGQKEIVDTITQTVASQALVDLANEYLRKSFNTSSKTEIEILKKKACETVTKVVEIDPDPLNYYKIGNILEKFEELHQAKICFQEFLKHASDLMKKDNQNYRKVVQLALVDVKSKNIDI